MPPSREEAKKKKQLIVIAILLVGLLLAFVTQPSSNKPAKVSINKQPAIKNVVLKAAPKSIDLEGEVIQVIDLPKSEIESITQSNLFFIPEPEPEPEVLEEDLVIEQELAPVVVKAIYGGVHMKAPKRVLIDDSIVAPGEALPDGRVILDITAGGVAIGK